MQNDHVYEAVLCSRVHYYKLDINLSSNSVFSFKNRVVRNQRHYITLPTLRWFNTKSGEIVALWRLPRKEDIGRQKDKSKRCWQ